VRALASARHRRSGRQPVGGTIRVWTTTDQRNTSCMMPSRATRGKAETSVSSVGRRRSASPSARRGRAAGRRRTPARRPSPASTASAGPRVSQIVNAAAPRSAEETSASSSPPGYARSGTSSSASWTDHRNSTGRGRHGPPTRSGGCPARRHHRQRRHRGSGDRRRLSRVRMEDRLTSLQKGKT